MAKRKSKDGEKPERIKFIIEAIGVLSAVVVAYFAYQAFRLQKLSSGAEITVVDTPIPLTEIEYRTGLSSTGTDEQYTVFSCRYRIELSNKGGADTFVSSVTYNIRSGTEIIKMNFDDVSYMQSGIDADDRFVLTGKFTEMSTFVTRSRLRLPAHSIQVLQVTLEILYPEENYEPESGIYALQTAFPPSDRSMVIPVDLDITVHFTDASPLVIKSQHCVNFNHK
jgi:hypothetical protein